MDLRCASSMPCLLAWMTPPPLPSTRPSDLSGKPSLLWSLFLFGDLSTNSTAPQRSRCPNLSVTLPELSGPECEPLSSFGNPLDPPDPPDPPDVGGSMPPLNPPDPPDPSDLVSSLTRLSSLSRFILLVSKPPSSSSHHLTSARHSSSSSMSQDGLLSSAGSSFWSPVTLRLCPAKVRRLLLGLEILKLSPVLSTTKTACLRVSCVCPDDFIPALLPVLQVEGKLSALSLPVNLVLSNSFKELSSSPIFPPMWSNLDIQASPVLQGSSSWLIVFSAFGAVLVILRITVDAVIQEAHEIVLVVRFLLAYFYGLYRQSISRLTIFCWSFWHFLPCFCVSLFEVDVSRTLPIEVVTF